MKEKPCAVKGFDCVFTASGCPWGWQAMTALPLHLGLCKQTPPYNKGLV